MISYVVCLNATSCEAWLYYISSPHKVYLKYGAFTCSNIVQAVHRVQGTLWPYVNFNKQAADISQTMIQT